MYITQSYPGLVLLETCYLYLFALCKICEICDLFLFYFRTAFSGDAVCYEETCPLFQITFLKISLKTQPVINEFKWVKEESYNINNILTTNGFIYVKLNWLFLLLLKTCLVSLIISSVICLASIIRLASVACLAPSVWSLGHITSPRIIVLSTAVAWTVCLVVVGIEVSPRIH